MTEEWTPWGEGHMSTETWCRARFEDGTESMSVLPAHRWSASQRRATHNFITHLQPFAPAQPDATALAVKAAVEALETIIALRDGYSGPDEGRKAGYRVADGIAERALSAIRARSEDGNGQ